MTIGKTRPRLVQTQAILFFNQCRKRSDPTKNDSEMMNFSIESKLIEDNVIQIQSRSMSDPLLSDIDFKNKTAWVWTTLNISIITVGTLSPTEMMVLSYIIVIYVRLQCLG